MTGWHIDEVVISFPDDHDDANVNVNTGVGHQTKVYGELLLICLSFPAWEYCGLEGHTRYGVRCLSECAQNGEKYW